MANLPDIKRGNTYRFTYTHMHNGEPADLSGCSIALTVKELEGDEIADDSTAPIQKIFTEHLEQSGDTLGKTVIELTPEETLKHKTTGLLIEANTYTYDLKVKHLDGSQFTEEEGKVKVDIAPTNIIL